MVTAGAIGILDQVLSSQPYVNLIWGFFKEGSSALHVVKKKKIEELLVFVTEHVHEFSPLLEDEQFVDGLGITFDAYLKQRSEDKRRIMQSIFLGFSLDAERADFELERMFDVLSKLSALHIDLLKELSTKGEIEIQKNQYFNSHYDEIRYLESLGLASIYAQRDVQKEMWADDEGEQSYETGEFVLREKERATLSDFGDSFLSFIKASDIQ